MFIVRSKITNHIKKLENMAYTQEKNHSIETDPEITDMTELADEDLKTAIINML